MPILTQPDIKTEIRKINDVSFSGFVGFPASVPDSGDRWGDMMSTVVAAIVPACTTQATAKAAFKVTLISDLPTLGIVGLQNAFDAYAAAVALGMTGYTGTPPPPIDLSAIPALGLGGASADTVADAIATIIETWLKLGSATNISGTILWS